MAAESKTVVYAAIAGNLAIAVAKFVAGGFTGSSAMLAEGIHSLVDTGNGGLLLLGYLEHLRHARPDALRVSLADKVDNARAIAADYRLLGEALWSRFSVGQQDQLWYYRSLVEVIGKVRPPCRLLGQLETQVTELESLVAAGG